jgi:hypothetical protein
LVRAGRDDRVATPQSHGSSPRALDRALRETLKKLQTSASTPPELRSAFGDALRRMQRSLRPASALAVVPPLGRQLAKPSLCAISGPAPCGGRPRRCLITLAGCPDSAIAMPIENTATAVTVAGLAP